MENDIPLRGTAGTRTSEEAELQAAKDELHSDEASIEVINPDPDEDIPED